MNRTIPDLLIGSAVFLSGAFVFGRLGPVLILSPFQSRARRELFFIGRTVFRSVVWLQAEVMRLGPYGLWHWANGDGLDWSYAQFQWILKELAVSLREEARQFAVEEECLKVLGLEDSRLLPDSSTGFEEWQRAQTRTVNTKSEHTMASRGLAVSSISPAHR